MSVQVVSFGCRLNTAEAEVIRRNASAGAAGETVVVNTCAVTGEAVRQARQAIRKVRRERPEARIVVTGCAAQTEPETFARMGEVDRVLGNAEKMTLEGWADDDTRALPIPVSDLRAKLRVGDIMAAREQSAHLIEGLEGRTRAFVQVQNGCDHRCTFCIIPFGRGNSRSVPAADAVAQVATLTENGYREVVLTGVDLTSYGNGVPGAPFLGLLVRQILRGVPALERLRLSSIDAVEADPELLDCLATEPRLMPHLHLSLQAGDDLILKRMKRRHSRAQAIAFCRTLRRLRPDIVLGADFIAGFPTETEDMFRRTLDLVEECGLTHLHVFPFSARPGTPAARMPLVPREISKERAFRLRQRGRAALEAYLDGRAGKCERVLLETAQEGRTEHFTQVRLARPAHPGTIIDATILGREDAVLLAA